MYFFNIMYILFQVYYLYLVANMSMFSKSTAETSIPMDDFEASITARAFAESITISSSLDISSASLHFSIVSYI